jgi:AcrR family transcriptional regulator
MNAVEPKIDTKQRILDSAERLFADRGFEATSLRTIIGDAGVNLAAVHYHYHSKDALLDAVILRRIGPVNSERLRMLDACERAAGEGPASLESVLTAFLGPPFRLGSDPQSKTFLRLMGRIMSDSTAVFRLVVEDHFRVILERFSIALQKAAPELPRQEILWRLSFVAGAMAHTLRFWGQELGPSLVCLSDTSDPEGAVARLVSFGAAGFRAPLIGGEKHE